MRIAFLCLAATLAALTSHNAAAAELLAPKDLEAGWFDGRKISTVGPRGGRSEFSFQPGGKLVRTGGRAGAASEGTWRLDEDGFCMTLAQGRRESCFLAVKNTDGSLRVIRRSGGAFVWSR
jgi:hypothetical protein